MSSRLFQTIREERGLAYSIYSETEPVSRYGLAGRVRRVCGGEDARGAGADAGGVARG